MKKWSAIVLVSVLLLLLSGCGSQARVLNVYNWGDYIDDSVIADFEKEYSVKVNYETFATNEDMYTKIKNGGTHYDVAIPSDYMIEKMANEGMLETIDVSTLSNYKNIGDAYKGLPFDPSNQYAVPYMWGTVGILYNKSLVQEPVESWGILWDEKYKGQILMLDSQRDSLMAALKSLGYSMNTQNMDELNAAKDLLIKQKPLVMAYVVDNGKQMMIAGEAAFMMTWNGEAVWMMEENEDLGFAIPKEGTNLWYDAMVIPKGAEHKEDAMLFIDYMNRPEVAKKNAEYIGYSTTNVTAMAMLDEAVQNNPIAYPSIDQMKNNEVFNDPGAFIEQYNQIWTEIKAN
jgi:spermidine/putrescine transport system substrate-binding protein